MILDVGMTLEHHGKTHCGRETTTDPIAHVVKDADADRWSNQPCGAESIQIRVSLTSIGLTDVVLIVDCS